MVSKVTSPFAVAPAANKVNNSEQVNNADNDNVNRNNSSSLKREDSRSTDEWRASEPNDKINKMVTKQDSMGKDEILDQWLKKNPNRNGTITEDVDAENEVDSNRMSKSSLASENHYRNSESQPQTQQQEQELPLPQSQQQDQPQNIEEEEENELHKIHMLQSLQALQYMKKVPLPPIEELEDKLVFLPPPKLPHIKKTLIFDMDETLIH